MKAANPSVLGAAAIALPDAALAQSADVTCCRAMVAKYREFNRSCDPQANVAAAASTCDTKPGEVIPALETQR